MENERTPPLPGLQPPEHICSLYAGMGAPAHYEDLLLLGGRVTNHIWGLFEGRLAPEDRALWRQIGSEKPWTKAEDKRIFGAFDKTIIECAQTLGWLVYLSPPVQQRMAKWSCGLAQGPDFLEQLGRAAALAVRVGYGEAKLAISEPEWKKIKPQALNELRRLFKQYRHKFNSGRGAPSNSEARNRYRVIVEGSPNAFPFLSENLPSLFRYLDHAAQGDVTLPGRIALGNLRPGNLFDGWGAWSRGGLSSETFRQAISNLPAKKL